MLWRRAPRNTLGWYSGLEPNAGPIRCAEDTLPAVVRRLPRDIYLQFTPLSRRWTNRGCQNPAPRNTYPYGNINQKLVFRSIIMPFSAYIILSSSEPIIVRPHSGPPPWGVLFLTPNAAFPIPKSTLQSFIRKPTILWPSNLVFSHGIEGLLDLE